MGLGFKVGVDDPHSRALVLMSRFVTLYQRPTSNHERVQVQHDVLDLLPRLSHIIRHARHTEDREGVQTTPTRYPDEVVARIIV